MAGRLLMKNAAPLAGKLLKPMSPVTSIGVRSKVDVTIDSNTGIATITMNSPPANVMGPKFIQEMTEAISTVESEAKGAILTSGLPTIFSAGLDIMVMYQPTEERLRTFWTALQDMWLALYSCGKPIVSVINGQAPAGGCLMSCSTDHRIMLEYENDGQGKPNRIGLNETKLGIIAPFWFKNVDKGKRPRSITSVDALMDQSSIKEIGSKPNCRR
ncbi:unnamed protein product [Cyprideis torosa]|uniref:Uncharacterized protein n=1 Tax=Cyprideis torosa TaxID=163714 RepID=A0A7R8WMD7_9CRUS|nr:unnamed protein product [Cyprideis torosa]CAG0902630.1 unnamed protein product [Cyprideis torosa]